MEIHNKSSLAILFLVVLIIIPMFQHSCLGQYAPSPLTPEQQDFLTAHNNARAAVGVGEMTWNDTVATFAQNYASQIKNEDCSSFTHSDNPDYGENIAEGTSLTSVGAVNMWVSESSYYDYDSNTCTGGQECHHYTQVVWRNSIHLGCARVACNSGEVFVTCNYAPAGNIIGQSPY